MRLSVIIPAINEAGDIGRTVTAARGAPDVEVILADGGSTDDTREEAGKAGAVVVDSEPGRAAQMNAGASAASGDTLLFLHADTILPVGYHTHIDATLSRPGLVAGAFRLAIDSPSGLLRIIEWLANFRSAAFGMPYGDQGIFMRADVFARAGGYPELPIMEDFELMRRLGRIGRIGLADAAAVTSARRWDNMGVFRATLVNQLVIAGYMLGIGPERLRTLYQRGG